MVGNVVYIIVQYLIREGDRQIMTVHATWDGAYARMLRLRTVSREHGYDAEFASEGVLEVRYKDKVVYEFKVQTRTIEL